MQWLIALPDELAKHPGTEGILKDPKRLLNCDESGHPLDGSNRIEAVFAIRGSRNVFKTSAGSKNQITVMHTISAAGEYYPPYVVIAGKPGRVNYGTLDGMTDIPDMRFWKTENGWMNGESFIQYLRFLDDWLEERPETKRPVVLFLDGASQHISFTASNFAKEHGIILIYLPANSTHGTQPLDVSFFSPLKTAWTATIESLQTENFNFCATQKNFPMVLARCINNLDTKAENARSGFRMTGIFPHNPLKPMEHKGRYAASSLDDEVKELMDKLPAASKKVIQDEDDSDIDEVGAYQLEVAKRVPKPEDFVKPIACQAIVTYDITGHRSCVFLTKKKSRVKKFRLYI